ncbi:HD domain-containing protein [Sinorhizobium medicae]
MEDQKTRLLAGVVIPDADVVRLAWEFAEARCEPYLFNHVVRSWLFATSIASIQNVEHDREVLAIGALLHDVTLNMSFRGPRRFEVEAADIAREFAIDAGLEPRRVQLVWDCVALNSTPSIGLYKEAEVSLCTAGICLDVVGLGYERVRAVEMKAITTAFPRLRPEKEDDEMLLSYGRSGAANHIRQLSKRLRTSLCRRILPSVVRGLRDEHSVRELSFGLYRIA